MRTPDDDLADKIIGCAYRVHNTLGAGFLEKVYQNAMQIELEKAGLHVQSQALINVYYDGQVVGEFFADLLVEHEVQLVNYLTATGLETGLLLNFGKSMEPRRKFRLYRRPSA
jgi:hypothetical protein